MLEAFNQRLFLSINAEPTSSAAARLLGVAAAEWLFWLVPIALVIGWICGGSRLRHALLVSTIAASAGVVINQGIAQIWPHPRPFMIGLGQQLIAHQPDASFPSDHLTVVWAVAFSLLFASGIARKLGMTVAILGVMIAWGRIFAGVHFPFDMLGSAVVGVVVSAMAWVFGSRLCVRMLRLALLIERWAVGRVRHGHLRPRAINHQS